MIGHDEPMALVITHKSGIKRIINLGHCTLTSAEYDRLHNLAVARGYTIYLTDVVEEVANFPRLYNEVCEAIGA